MVPQPSAGRRTDDRPRPIGRRQFLATTAGVAATAAAGCLGQLGSDGGNDSVGTPGWKTYRGDRQRTGRVPAEEGPGESLSVAWESSALDLAERQLDITVVSTLDADDETDAATGSGQCSPATLTDDLVLCSMQYQVDDGAEILEWGGIVALDAATGSVEWTIQGMPPTLVPPSVIEDRLYLPVAYPPDSVSEPPHLLVADAESGEVHRREAIPGVEQGDTVARRAVTIAPDAAYFPPWIDAEWDALAVDPTSGERRWTATTGNPAADYAFTPVDDQVLYAAAAEGSQTDLVALDAGSGDERWRVTPAFSTNPSEEYHALLGSPTVVDDRGYVAGRWRGTANNERLGAGLYSFDPDGGDERWTFEPEGVPMDALTDDATTPDDCETAEDCSSETYAGLRGVPTVVDGIVLASGFGKPADSGDAHDRSRHVYAVDDDDGSLQWSVPGQAAAPVAAGDVIYVRFVEDSVAALSTDGDVLATVKSDGRSSVGRSPSIGHGRVYTQWGNSYVGSTPPDTMVAIE